MKKALLILTLLIPILTRANTYYFSNTGNDASAGCPITAPCKTVSRANAIVHAGDILLFQKGQIFPGAFSFNLANVQIGSFSSGVNPIISGFNTESTGWVANPDGKTWSIVDPGLSATALNMVVVNGVQVAMGKTALRIYSSFTSTTLTSTTTVGTFSGKPILVFRKTHYALDSYNISSISGSVITYSNPSGGGTTEGGGNGYFIQNAPETLVNFGDWCYDPTLKKLTMFFGAALNPSSYVIQASAQTYGYTGNGANVIINGVDFQGQNTAGINLPTVSNTTIENCNFKFEGISGIQGFTLTNWLFQNNTFSQCNNTAITVNISTNGQMLTSQAINIGLIPGAGGNIDQASGTGAYSAFCIAGQTSTNNLMQNLTVNGVGYNPIQWRGTFCTIQFCYTNNSHSVMDDGGAAYTVGGSSVTFGGMSFVKNCVFDNGIGAPAGTVDGKRLVAGVYCDNRTTNVTIQNVTISNMPQAGVYLHNSQGISILNDLIYNTGIGIGLQHDNVASDSKTGTITVNNNQIIAVSSPQLCFQIFSESTNTVNADLTNWGTASNNLYATTYVNTTPFKSLLSSSSGTHTYTLSGWQTATLQDAGSSLNAVTAVNYFYNNGTANPMSIPLTDNYVTLNATPIPAGSYTLAPFSGIFIIFSSHPALPPIFSYSPNTNTYTVSTPITPLTPISSGSTVTTYSVLPPFPAGINLNAGSGVVSGTPSIQSSTTTYTVSGTGTGGTGHTSLTLTVNGLPPNISYPSSAYVFPKSTTITPVSITNTGGAVTSAYSISSSLPIGMSFNTSNGQISGTPTTITALTNYQVIASNTNGADTAFVGITVSDIAPAITYSPTVNNFIKGTAIHSLTPIQSAGIPVSYTISPSLPTGLVFSTSTGVISGNPSIVKSSISYLVTATNSIGNGHTNVSISVTTTPSKKKIVVTGVKFGGLVYP